MADSKFFGGEKAPAGKEFRDGSSLGRGLKDLRKDVESAFLTQEASIVNLATEVDVSDADITLTSTTLFAGMVTLNAASAGKSLIFSLTAVEILAALEAKLVEIGANRVAQVDDAIRLEVVNHSNQTLTVTTPGNNVNLGNTSGVIAADTSAVLYVRYEATTPMFVVQILR